MDSDPRLAQQPAHLRQLRPGGIQHQVETVGEDAHPPGIPAAPQQVGRLLVVPGRYLKLEQLAGLGRLHGGGGALDHAAAGDQETEPVALLRLLQVVGGHQDGGAGTGEIVDQPPELAPRHRVDAGGGLIEEQHLRIVQHRRAEGHPLLPAPRQLAGGHVPLTLQPAAGQHPVDPLAAQGAGDGVDPGIERQVLADREVVVEGELLAHVADPAQQVPAAQPAGLPRQGHLAGAGFQQPAEHLDGGGLAGAVGPQKPEDLAVAHLQIHLAHRLEVAEAAGEGPGGDGRSPPLRALAGAGKGKGEGLGPLLPQPGDENVLEGGAGDLQLLQGQPLARQQLPHLLRSPIGVAHQHVQPVAEGLHIDDAARLGTGPGCGPLQQGLGPGPLPATQFQAAEAQALFQLGWCTDLTDPPLVDQADAVTALRLVQVGGGHQDRDGLAGKAGQHVPELATGHRIHPRGGLIQQQHLGPVDQGAAEGQLLLHAAGELAGQPVAEGVQSHQRQQLLPPLQKVAVGHPPQPGHVAKVLHHAEIGVEGEGLGEIAHPRAGQAGRLPSTRTRAGAGVQQAGQDVEGAGLAGAVGADQPEDLARADLEVDAPQRLQGPVGLVEPLHLEGDLPLQGIGASSGLSG